MAASSGGTPTLRALFGERQLTAVFAEAPTPMAVVDLTQRYLHVNEAMTRLLGRPESAIVGQHTTFATHPDDREESRQAYRRLGSAAHAAVTGSKRFLRPDGEVVHVVRTVMSVPDDAGRLSFWFAHYVDVTGEHAVAAALAATQRFHDDVVDALPFATVVLDGLGTVTAANDAWQQVVEAFGLASAGLGANLPASLSTGSSKVSDAAGLGHAMQDVLGGRRPDWAGDVACGPEDGLCWFALQVSALGNGAGALLTAVDVTDRKRAERRLAHEAAHDPLTGLLNRSCLERLLEPPPADTAGSRRALLFLDLDQFKLINDGYGHDVGDELLVAVADRLQRFVRTDDTLVRFAGDEFVVVCAGVLGEVHAVGIADRVLAAFTEPYVVAGIAVSLSASIGIAVDRDHAPAGNGLLAEADTALFQAKARGRARYAVFDGSARNSARLRLETAQALRRAVSGGELVVHYQPVVTLADGRTVGVEALVRWQRPGAGLVPPAQFIPLAEDTGLIVPLGRGVLQAAVQQAATWAAAGRPLRCAVNVSPRQLSVPGFVEDVAGILGASGLDPALLQLELTESTVMDVEVSQRVLARLLELGVTVAIDDFGTGHSSLARLKRLPGVTTLKIDRSFVAGLPEQDDDRQIVTAVLRLAAALGLSVVAEGVERPEQRDWLAAHGCLWGQGFLYGAAVPAPELARVR